MYTLLGADGRSYSSENRGTLGGNSKLRIYGQLDRPCGNCMRAQYREWKSRQPGTA